MVVPAACRLLAVALLTVSAASLVSGTPCPTGWRQSGAWCYLTNVSSSLSWAGAMEFCQENGGSLVMIENRSKLLDVVDLLRVVGIDKGWWIGIRKTSGTTSIAERDANVYENFGEEKVIKNVSLGGGGSHQCVFMTSVDGFWYWTACDSALNYICQKEADRVHVVVVTPEQRRPDPAWLRAHEAELAAQLLGNDSAQDDKGEFSASKVTMTPIPPTTTTTPMPPTTTTAAGDTGPPVTTPSPCSGDNWWLLTSRCHHLFVDAESFDEAEQLCQAKGGHLSQFENEAAQTTFRNRYGYISGSTWIGLSRTSGWTPFQWINTDVVPDFSSWAPGHPVINETCVALDLSTNKWITADCATPKPFSCYRSVGATERPPTVTTTPSNVAAPCGGGDWWQFGSSCLLLVSNTPASWHAAERDCRNRSATQVQITNYHFNQHIREKLNGVSAWIGLSKLNANRTYRWTDGTAVDYTNWSGTGATSTEMASCAQLDGGHGYWRPVNCNAPLPYVCQRPVDGSRPQLPPPARPPHRSSCPPAWQPYGADRCLQISNRTMTWAAARQWCRDQADGGDLLSVPSAVHQAFLTSAVKGSKANLWISLSYGELDRRRFLTWTDESPVNYTNWAPGQPSTPCLTCPKTCGVVDGRKTHTAAAWSDVDCSITYGAVCQRPATPNNSIAVTQIFCNNTDSQYIAAADSCYKIVHDQRTWHDAADACQNEGSALAYVGDVFDNAELAKLLYRDGSDQYWLGLTDTGRHGMMEWTKPWPPVTTFVNWDPSYTRNPTRDSCAVFLPATGRWQHRDCSLERRPFVCQQAPEREAAMPPAGHCPAVGGWMAGDTRCYRAFQPDGVGLNWTEAKAACEQRGYQLATVSSVTDFRAIREAVKGLSSRFSAWIGLRSQQDKEYNWTDGSPMAYRAWQRSEPIKSAACVQASLLTNGRWRTMECSFRTAYICMTGMDDTETDAITGIAPSGGSGWPAFGVVILVLALMVALAGVGLWFGRRQRLSWLPSWVLGPRGTHHSVDNLAYSRHQNAVRSDGELENSNLDAIANRWGSQEQLVIHETL